MRVFYDRAVRSVRSSAYLMIGGFAVAGMAASFVLFRVATNWEGLAIFGLVGVGAFVIGALRLAGRQQSSR